MSVALVVAGAFFVLYPAIRPFADEASLAGAAAFASTSWGVSHALAMAAFALLSFALFGVYLHVRETTGSQRSCGSPGAR